MSARRIASAVLLPLLLLGVLAGCSSGEDGSSDTSEPTTDDTTADAGSDDQRVLALGEELVLADLLALGIRPVASSANVVVDGSFVGLDEFDTDDIEALVSTEPNFEQLAAYDADVVVATEFVVEQAGRELMESLGGELVVVPELDHEEQLLMLGEAFDRQDEAEALLAELDAAIERGREALGEDPPEVSVAAIYAGPSVAVWIDGPWDVPSTLLDLGVELRPGTDDLSGAQRGRVYLSNEQLGLLDADTILLLRADVVEGEAEAIESIQSNPLWERLPAVQADRVLTVDRLGYPGVAGRIRLVDDLVELLQS